MKNIRLAGFEVYLLQESLKHYKSLIAEEVFPEYSFITKEHVLNTIAQLEETLGQETAKEKRAGLYAAA